MRWILAGLVAAGIAVGAAAAAEEHDPATLVISAEGLVEAAPDMATIRVGVVEEAGTAREAIRRMSDGMEAVLSRLATFEIEERDIQTSSLSVQPRWEHRQNRAPVVTGFSARNMVTVRVRDLDNLGRVLDAVSEDGANRFESVSFGLSDPGPAEDAARQAAVAEARRKADLYAEALGVGLGQLLRFSESGARRPLEPGWIMETAQASDMARSVPVAAGELSVQASVTLVYEIRPAAQ